jgi:hypothetical protein
MTAEIEKVEAEIIALEERIAKEQGFVKAQLSYTLRENKILLKKLKDKYDRGRNKERT